MRRKKNWNARSIEDAEKTAHTDIRHPIVLKINLQTGKSARKKRRSDGVRAINKLLFSALDTKTDFFPGWPCEPHTQFSSLYPHIYMYVYRRMCRLWAFRYKNALKAVATADRRDEFRFHHYVSKRDEYLSVNY